MVVRLFRGIVHSCIVSGNGPAAEEGAVNRGHIVRRCGFGASERLKLLTDAGAEVEGADERLNEAKDLGESAIRGCNSR